MEIKTNGKKGDGDKDKWRKKMMEIKTNRKKDDGDRDEQKKR